MYYYTYYTYEEWGRGYIGCRKSKVPPEQDIRYMGSYRDKTFKPTQKIILQTYNTREEALTDEILLQRFFTVASNPHFANKSYQTSTKFSYVLTTEQARNNTIKLNQSRTLEQRKEIARNAGKARMASMTSEQRSQLGIKANASKTLEQRSEVARKAHANRTPEQRSKLGRKLAAYITPEQRSEQGRKVSFQRWQCTETGFITNAGNLSKYQRARGIDTSKRIRLS